MTPEHRFTILVAAVTGFPTVVFTGVVAYWTWRRDQERVIVRKAPVYFPTIDGTQTEAGLCGVGVAVTNLSLFPVRIAGLGFRLDGKHALAFDRDSHLDEWPQELASHARFIVYANDAEWKALERIGVRPRMPDWGFVAIARTETSRQFTSNRVIWRVKRLIPKRVLKWLR